MTPRGSTIVELTVAIAVVGVAILVMLQQISLSHHEEELAREKVFANQKALAMLSEIQMAVERGEIRDAAELEARADVVPSPVLSTLRPGGEELTPDHPMSANILRSSGWVWSRRLSVAPVPNDDGMRHVRVDVLRTPDGGGAAVVRATAVALVRVPEPSIPSVQEFDVYVLALAAVPSTFLPVSGLRPSLEAAIDSIQERSPCVRFRLHWITELGYGRDPLYVPYLNTTETAATETPWAFWYPGRVTEVSPSLFAPELFGGLVRTDTGLQNGYDATANPLPFTVADRFNHAMREPEARALFEARVAAGLDDPGEPPLQLLLEDMYRDPDRFRSAIVLNLHGDVLPYPPLRNDSDAARDPDLHPGVRVVTHPAHLRPKRDPDGDGDHSDSQDLELRVYAYKTDPRSGPDVLDDAITVRIFGIDLTRNVQGTDPTKPATLEIRRLPGGVNVDTGRVRGPSRGYSAFDSPEGTPPSLASREHAHEMAVEWGYATSPEPHTWIRLYGTPLVAPRVGTGGLTHSAWLWDMEHVPSPVAPASPAGDFPVDLASAGPGPKNTARWRIRIPKAVFEPGFPGGGWPDADRRVTVETTLGTAPGAGVAWPMPIRPRATSVTWAWWARSPDAVPLTERYQVLGDPRWNPYADLVAGGASFPHGYTWFFDDLRTESEDATPDWPCLDAARLFDGFADSVQADVPRIAQVWREALLSSSAIFTSFGGRLCGAVAMGGELSLPAAPGDVAPRAVQVGGEMFGASEAVSVDMLTPEASTGSGLMAMAGSGSGSPLRLGTTVVRDRDSDFWTRPWLGELVPDADWGDWVLLGNLRTAGSGGRFVHVGLGDVRWRDLPRGTDFTTPFGGLLDQRGGATLLRSGTPSGTFGQLVTPAGSEIAPDEGPRELFGAVGFGLPSALPGRLTFGFSEPLPAPLQQAPFTVEHPVHFAQQLERFALGPSQRSASGVVRLQSPDAVRRAFVVLHGETPETAPEQLVAMRSAALLALRGLHVAGHPAFDDEVPPVPRMLVLAPSSGFRAVDVTVLPIRWRVEFRRFDGAPYTSAYPPGYDGDERDLAYRVLVSDDQGATWRDARTDEPVDPSAVSDPSVLLADSGPGDESLVLDLPAERFPAGSYRFRVVCIDTARGAHRAWHEVDVTVLRTGGTGR